MQGQITAQEYIIKRTSFFFFFFFKQVRGGRKIIRLFRWGGGQSLGDMSPKVDFLFLLTPSPLLEGVGEIDLKPRTYL